MDLGSSRDLDGSGTLGQAVGIWFFFFSYDRIHHYDTNRV